MKTIGKSVVAVIGILLLTCVSCSKLETDQYDGYLWTGIIPSYNINGTTEETEGISFYITLKFKDKGSKCEIMTGMNGLYVAANLLVYEVNWSRRNRFTLCSSSGEQSDYSGTISGDVMKLRPRNCDGDAPYLELTRTR